jgi:hypothetical protein
MKTAISIVLLCALCLWADTKNEIDLRARLAAAETARAALTLEIAKLNAANATRANAALASTKSATAGQTKAGEIASAHADIAQSTAEANGAIAQKAAIEASAAAASAKESSSAVAAAVTASGQASRTQVTGLMITAGFGFLTLLAGYLYQSFTAQRDRRWLRQDAEEQGRRQAEIAKEQGAKLDQIHTLVNSNMTAEMEKSLAFAKANLLLLKKVAAFPGPTTDEDKAAIEETHRQVIELEAQLDDRLKQTTAAAQQLKVDLAKPTPKK